MKHGLAVRRAFRLWLGDALLKASIAVALIWLAFHPLIAVMSHPNFRDRSDMLSWAMQVIALGLMMQCSGAIAITLVDGGKRIFCRLVRTMPNRGD